MLARSALGSRTCKEAGRQRGAQENLGEWLLGAKKEKEEPKGCQGMKMGTRKKRKKGH